MQPKAVSSSCGINKPETLFLPVDGAAGTALVSVVTLTSTGKIPVPVDLNTEGLGKLASLGVGEELRLGQPVGSVLALGLECISDSIAVQLDVGLLDPVVLNSLEIVTVQASVLGSSHLDDKGLEIGVGDSQDEGVVAGIDVGGDQGGGLRVGTGNDQVLDTHDIELDAGGDQAVNVLRDGDQDLAGHVTALLGTGHLILQMDTGSTTLDKHLGELHVGSDTTVAGISISNDGAQKVDVGHLGTLLLGGGQAGLALLAIVEELGKEQVLDLVGDSVHGVISQIGAGLVGRRGGGGALPARDVDGLDVLGHLSDLDGIQSTEGVGGGLVLAVVLEELPELLGLDVGSVLSLDVAALGDNGLGRVRTSDEGEALGGPPGLDLSDLLLEAGLLGVDEGSGGGVSVNHCVVCVCMCCVWMRVEWGGSDHALGRERGDAKKKRRRMKKRGRRVWRIGINAKKKRRKKRSERRDEQEIFYRKQ